MNFREGRSRWIPLAAAVVPGWGHAILGLFRRGAVLYVLFLVALDLAALRLLASDGIASRTFWLGALGVLALVAFSLLDVRRMLFDPHAKARAALVRRHLREGVRHYLRGEYSLARNELRCALDLDPLRTEARLYLGLVLGREGRLPEARSLLRKCLEHNGGKWDWELRREIRSIEARLPREAAGPQPTSVPGSSTPPSPNRA